MIIMKTVAEIYSEKTMPVSFEMFPPKGEFTYESAYEASGKLTTLEPDFMSVTYSAGGSGNSEGTGIVASLIQDEFTTPAVAHVTCINKDEDGLNLTIADFKSRHIKNVLALRGDVPAGVEQAGSPRYPYASDLIGVLVDAGFCVGAAAYPEGHIECLDVAKDVEFLKAKQDAGASFFVTQLFFDNDYFYRFKELTDKAGITIPISCGIMPFLGKSQLQRMVFLCGASLPAPIIKLLARYENDPVSLRAAGIEYACNQLLDLAEHGVDGLHVYTMNSYDIAKSATDALVDAGVWSRN